MKDFLKVYVSRIPPEVVITDVIPEIRNKEIQNCKSEMVKKERFWAWKVLEESLKKENLSIEELNLQKLGNGKWVSDKIYFSLTHSHGMVGVAVSSHPVGVDLETWMDFEKKNYKLENMIKKFCTEEELKKYPDASEKRRFLELWTQKEAAFKENPAEEGFYSKNIELISEKLFTKYDFLEETEYCISVCSVLKDMIKKIQVVTDVTT